jgi:UDPglucose--hexose-1-phosphate uridylyltransferase
MAEMSSEDILNIIQNWNTEFLDISKKEGIQYILIFENKGAVMGCSNPHPHGQVIE